MKLTKAHFAAVDPDIKGSDGKPLAFDVNFNPKELQLESQLSYAPAQNQQDGLSEMSFKGGSNYTLSMTLYFDTFEEGVNVRAKWLTKLEKLCVSSKAKTAKTPDATTQDLAPQADGHADIEKQKPPPDVLFTWGPKFRFCGVITQLSQHYTMFLADGTPVRCEVSLSMQQTMISHLDNDLGDGDHADTTSKVANDVKGKGAAGMAGLGADADFDDPQEIMDKANNLDSAKLGKTGLSGFMQNHGSTMFEGALGGAIGGLFTGQGAGKGAMDGVLRGAGDTGLFSEMTGGSMLGGAADTLASGNQVNLGSVGLGRLGSLGLGLQRGPDGHLYAGSTGGVAAVSLPTVQLFHGSASTTPPSRGGGDTGGGSGSTTSSGSSASGGSPGGGAGSGRGAPPPGGGSGSSAGSGSAGSGGGKGGGGSTGSGGGGSGSGSGTGTGGTTGSGTGGKRGG
jgi:hypothetical protein